MFVIDDEHNFRMKHPMRIENYNKIMNIINDYIALKEAVENAASDTDQTEQKE